ncbi:MAG: ABC transporter permease [Salinivirgaceae bacterium]|nr:ABC transporter permease [Salinivirgaceae bacterium]
MTTLKYILKSLKYYKNKHAAILIGTIISTAILTGALIVGDSVKYSLQQLVGKRLANVVYALETGDRLVSNTLAKNLQEELDCPVAGLLKLNGIAINNEAETRLNNIQVLGVDVAFSQMTDSEFPVFANDEVLINENAANRLKLSIGDEVLLRVEQLDVIPVNAPFAQEKTPTVAFRLTVKNILSDEQFGRFSLKSDQKAPFNIWIQKSLLWEKLALTNKINTVLITDKENNYSEKLIDESFEKLWTPEDASLKVDNISNSKSIEITSDRIFIDEVFSDAINANFSTQGVLTYLVNSISTNKNSTPYSFTAGVSKDLLSSDLKSDEIILNDWCANDLEVAIGDSVSLNYYVIGAFRKLEARSKSFILKSIQKNQSGLFIKELTPNFPGFNDAESCSEWDTGVPIDLDKIRDKDEAFWDAYNATPKALVSLESAQQMWGNLFGETTALRIVKNEIDQSNFSKDLSKLIKPKTIGLHFVNVKESGTQATVNSVDFGELFLSLSFFVIAAGVLLLILLYVLNIISRKSEIGVLSALGFKPNKIIRLFLLESLFTIIIGGLIGVDLGVFYNGALIKGLNSVWHDAVRTNALEILVLPKTLIIGYVSGVFIAFISIFFVIRKQVRQTITKSVKLIHTDNLHLRRNRISAFTFLIIGFFIVVYSIATNQIQNAALFLSAGGIILFALISFVALFLKKQLLNFSSSSLTVTKLALKNLSRQRARSLMTIALLALGTFSVIITGANRKTFYNAYENRQSGTGGFLYWVENSLPIVNDLNSKSGQEIFNMDDEAILDSIEFIQMLTLAGDDASCLNLNQVQQPQILAIKPEAFSSSQAFSFANLLDDIDEKNPWLELDKKYNENTIPAYVDQTVITWGLMKKVGDTLIYKDEFGENLNLLIAGGLNSSIFQGNVLIADKYFKQHFPNAAGSKIMLIDGNKDNISGIVELLNFYFQDYGVDYELTTQRLDNFNSVTNTYLNVFMLLGGLGVIIGTIGFGIVLLRNKMERKHELALLTAIGIKKKQLFVLIFKEHLILLLIGLAVGVISAFVGIIPSIISPSFSIPIAFISLLIGAILLNGIFWIAITALSTEDNLIESLRRE